jgi:hypothetical protein
MTSMIMMTVAMRRPEPAPVAATCALRLREVRNRPATGLPVPAGSPQIFVRPPVAGQRAIATDPSAVAVFAVPVPTFLARNEKFDSGPPVWRPPV